MRDKEIIRTPCRRLYMAFQSVQQLRASISTANRRECYSLIKEPERHRINACLLSSKDLLSRLTCKRKVKDYPHMVRQCKHTYVQAHLSPRATSGNAVVRTCRIQTGRSPTEAVFVLTRHGFRMLKVLSQPFYKIQRISYF
jgi:hypothetical protein